jgi:catechol 2,3-dioxygenase-like lactoylglutathione lyase family enzyme
MARTAKRAAAKRASKKTARKATKRAARPRKKVAAKRAGKASRTAKPARGTTKARPAAPARAWVERARPEALRLRGFAPGLTVADLDTSIDFYTRGLGFVVSERWEKDGALVGVMLKAGVCELGIGQDDWAKGRDRVKGTGVRLWCETRQDVNALAARARAWGARLTEEPEDKPWGVRAFSLDDPDGYHLTFYRGLGG